MTRSPLAPSLVLAFVAAALAPLLLWAAGGVFLPGTQPADGEGDPTFPPFMNEGAAGEFDAPGVCDGCHADYRQLGQPIHEPTDSWAGSLMANAARDPLFWAAVDIANQDDALLGDAGVGDFCIRCHLPVAWYEGRSDCTTAWGEEFDGSCFEGPPEEPDNDFEGITCHFCHRMYDASDPPPGQLQDPAAPYGENGQVYLTTESDRMYGPYADADPRRHDFEFSPFHRSAAFCGQCHDVTHPALNRRDPASGVDLGYPMPIERTWSEYQQSAYALGSDPAAATCQDCHMAPPDLDGDGLPDPAFAAKQEPFLRGDDAAEGDFHAHWFAGGGAWMIDVLKSLYGVPLEREASFDAAREQSLALLQERTADLRLDAPPMVAGGDDLLVDVAVVNRAGHKLPTGYPEGRRAWLRLAVGEDLDADGQLGAGEILFESGAWDPATGILDEDPQAKVYELKVGVFDWNGTGQCDLVDGSGRKMFHFVLNDCIVKDNRIPPLGFVPNVETAPVAYSYPDNPARPGTLLNEDLSQYTVSVPAGLAGPLLVEASLLYQTTSKEYVDFLRDESVSTCDPFDAGCDPTLPDGRLNRGEKMHELWETHGRSAPVELARASTSVQVTVAPPTGACCIGPDCFELTEVDCLAGSGLYRGDGVDCTDADCAPPTGACCIGPDCFELSQSDCVDASGLYRGDGVACADTDCGGPAVVPGEARDLRVTKLRTGELDLTWTPACDAGDHALLSTALGNLPTGLWIDATCGHGPGGALTLAEPPSSVAFLIVGQTVTAEGSYGRDSFAVERPERDTGDGCDRPQDLNPTCE